MKKKFLLAVFFFSLTAIFASDLSLEQVLEAAKTRSHERTEAVIRLSADKKAQKAAYGTVVQTLELSAGYLNQVYDKTVNDGVRLTANISTSLGNYLSGIENAKKNKEISAAELELADRLLRSKAYGCYMNLLMCQNRIAILDEVLDEERIIFNEVKRNYEEGSIVPSVYLEASASLIEKENERRNAEAEKVSAEKQMELLTGLNAPFHLTTDITLFTPVLANSVSAENGTAIRMLENSISRLDTQKSGLNKNAFLPFISYNMEGDYINDVFQLDHSVSIGWDLASILPGSENRSTANNIATQKMILEEEKKRITEETETEIATELLRIESLGKNISLLKTEIKETEDIYKNVKADYEEGIRTASEVNKVLNVLTSNKLRLLDFEDEYLSVILSLENITGQKFLI